jgi:abhydrolase domain-containing protein 17
MKQIIKATLIGEFSWRRVARSTVLIPFCVCVGLFVIAIFFPDRFIFQPQPTTYRDTADIIKIRTVDGGEISARFSENPAATYTILFAHGNAEDIGLVEPFAWRIKESGFNVLTFDYQGYGTSLGTPSEANVYGDIHAAYEFLTSEKLIPPNKIILHGRSLGGAAAVDLASRREIAGLILESTFTTAFRVVTRYPMFPFDKFNSIDKIGSVRCPVLVIHGTDDWTIPVYHGQRLFEAANEPKQALWVEGAGHNDLFYTDQQRYLNTVKNFAKEINEE